MSDNCKLILTESAYAQTNIKNITGLSADMFQPVR
jgi:hypothetical protein